MSLKLFFLVSLFLQTPGLKAEITSSDTELAFILLHGEANFGETSYGERTWYKFNESSPTEKERLLPLLCAGVSDPDKEVRDSAVSNLAIIGQNAVPCLTEALKDKSDDIKIQALWGLPKLKDTENRTQEEIIKLLKYPNQNIRRIAIETLGKVGFPSEEALSALKDKYNSNEDGFRSYAACALANIGDLKEGLPLLQKDLADNVTCIGWLGPKASSLIPDLVDLGKKDMSYALVIALGKMGKDAAPALPLLIKELQNGKNPLWAATGIINIGVATDDVLAIIDRVGPYTHLTPPASFSSFGQKGAGKVFNKLMEIRNTTKEKEWIDIRISEMSPYLKTELLSLFKKNAGVDSALFRSIAKCGPEAAKPIAAYLKDKQIYVRLNAVNALKDMGPQAADAIPELLEFIKDTHNNRFNTGFNSFSTGYHNNDLNAVDYAYEAMGGIGKKAFPYLQKILTSNKPESWALIALGHMPAKKEIVEFVLPFLSHPDKAMKIESIKSLARLHIYPDKCVPALVIALDDSDDKVSNEAIVGLQAFGPEAKSAIPPLKAKLQEAMRNKNTNSIYALAHALNSINDTSKEVTNLALTALLSIDPYRKMDQVRIFRKMGNMPEKYVKGFFDHIASLDGYDLAVAIQVLSESKLIKDRQLIDLTHDSNNTIASAACQILCETGTVEAKKAYKECNLGRNSGRK